MNVGQICDTTYHPIVYCKQILIQLYTTFCFFLNCIIFTCLTNVSYSAKVVAGGADSRRAGLVFSSSSVSVLDADYMCARIDMSSVSGVLTSTAIGGTNGKVFNVHDDGQGRADLVNACRRNSCQYLI